MIFLLKIKVSALKVSFLTLWLCLPLSLWSQITKLAVLLGTKNTNEVSLAQTALSNLTKDDFVYLVIYSSNEKDKFAIFNSGKIRPKSPIDLATWLMDPIKNVDQLDPTKDIVLLSSVNSAAAQAFADIFGENDNKAKRRIRKIISWDEDVLLYKNGTFLAYGLCYEYEWKSPRKELVGTAIPTGRVLSEQEKKTPSDFIVLSQAPNTLREWLRDWMPLETKDDIMESAKDLTRKQPQLYDALVQNKRCFMLGWRYLWELEYKSSLVADLNFLCDVATVNELYTRNKALHPDSMADYHNSFAEFIKKVGKKEEHIKNLMVSGLFPYQFAAAVQTAINKMTVAEFLEKKTNVSSIFTKQVAVISDSEPKLAAELEGASPQQLPKPLWEALRKILTDKDYIKGITLLAPARSKLMGLMNERIGQDIEVDILKLKNITVTTGFVKQGASWGSIFEEWVRTRWTKLFSKENPIPTNKGKISFPFNVTGEGETEKRVLVDKPEDAKNKLGTRTIDCSYQSGTGTFVETGDNCNLVAVEVKHITGRLSGDPLKQFYDNVAIVRAKPKRLKRIEYIFSSEKTAKDNKNIFIPLVFDPSKGFNANERGALFQVFFINDLGEKKIIQF